MTILPCLSRFCGTTDKPGGERCPNRVSCYALKGQKRIHATFRHGTYMQLQECRRAVYLGSWRNFIWEVGGIPFGKLAEKRLCGIED